METNEYQKMYDIEKSYWWFLGKHRLVDLLVGNYLRESARQRLLDVGCGTGVILELLKTYGMAVGIELSGLAISFAKRRNLHLLVQSDASRGLPFKDNSFSIITCLDVLEHLDDDSHLIEEMLRVCQPAGHIIITVPAMNSLWSEHDLALHHRRRYRKGGLLAHVAHLDCLVAKATFFNTFLFLPIFAARKVRALFQRGKAPRSDFFLPLPSWLNSSLYFLYSLEIALLPILNLPFGISLLVILQKKPRRPSMVAYRG
ncbi:MAG: class I SAM-dependent methyltransferase [candidate division WOR-3 bacterium]